jgi:hydrogenase expression/formation protein HypE
MTAGFECPVPGPYANVVLAHGGGGRLTEELVRDVFLRAFPGQTLAAREDQASVTVPRGRVAVTTDAFVVRPVFFPGGDIGKLSVCGTVNDLAVGGAEPLYLTAAFVLEEGFPLRDLARIAASMQATCAEAGVEIVAGDTKVVERGHGDGVYITTTGVGVLPDPGERPPLSCANARPGDRVLVSGPVGDHGVAVLSVREGLSFETSLVSDCAPLAGLSRAIVRACPRGLRAMRDPTRGGLATALHEIAAASGVAIEIEEPRIPVRPEVEGACELLGLDPLYVACEGRLIAIVAPDEAPAALAAMRADPLGAGAAEIGSIAAGTPRLTLRSGIGGRRVLSPLSGEPLPRIC